MSCECGQCKTCKKREARRLWRAANVEHVRQKAAEYAKRYRQKNPEKVRAQKRAYYRSVESASAAFKAKEAARLKAYQKAHPEKSRDRTARYRERNRDVINAKTRDRRAVERREFPELVRAKKRRYYERNKASVLARQRAAYAAHLEPRRLANVRYSRKHFLGNVDAIREYKRSWARTAWGKNLERSRERARLQQNRRRARLRDSCSPGVKAHEWAAICERYTFEAVTYCAYCKVRAGVTIEHVVPLSRGGLDEPGNVVPACRTCNSSKGSKLLSEWRYPNASVGDGGVPQL